MSTYDNFYKDFPVRCQRLLKDNWLKSSINGLEVTLMIATATAGFVIPFERLRPSNDSTILNSETKRVTKFGRFLNKRFINWIGHGSWEYIPDVAGKVIRENEVDSWVNSKDRQLLSADKNIEHVFALLRNALAHGNIFTMPSFPDPSNSDPPQIESLLFLSKVRDRQTRELLDMYNVILTDPHSFSIMLDRWFKYLNEIETNPGIEQQRDISENDIVESDYRT